MSKNIKKAFITNNTNEIYRLIEIFFKLTNLKVLILHFNTLSSLEPNLFKDLYNLKKLHLSHNKITTIKAETFQGLTNLEKLELDNNDITDNNDNNET